MRFRGYLLVLGAAGSLLGCGKSEGGATPIQRDQLPSKVANLLCDSRASCCQGEGFAFDAADCKVAFAAQLEENLRDEISPNVEYDAQAAGDCLASAASTIQCGDLDDDDVPACERIFRGKLALGAACNSSDECREDSGQTVQCTSNDGLSPEVCTLVTRTPAPRGKAGESCFTTCFEEENCSDYDTPTPAPGGGAAPLPTTDPVTCYRDDGLFCNSGTCAPLVALGTPCSDYAACVGNAFCDFNSQLCTAPRANGEPCQGSDECQSGRCEDSLASDGTANPVQVCASRTGVTAEECSEDFGDETDSSEPAPSPNGP